MPVSYPNLPWVEYLSIGLLSAILLFVSIVIHELAHSIVAKNNGLKIAKITLYLLGGVSEMSEEPPTASLELKMSAAGPLTSIAIAIICLFGWIASVSIHAPVLVQGPLQYAFYVNALVAGFNLIPAFPMDGGRILRALIWRGNNDVMRSTRIASSVGRIFAYIFMFVGIFYLFFIDIFDGLWLLLIGWFVSSGASSELNQMIVKRDLSGLKAGDVMTRAVDSVSPDTTLTELSSKFLEDKHNGFPVMGNDGKILGCVTMEDMRKTKKSLRDTTLVKDIMTPREKLVTVKSDDPAELAVNLMSKNRIGRVFVVESEDGKLSGLITRSDIMKTIQVQESILGTSKAGAERQRSISVEKGMMFEIDCPVVRGLTWSATFNTGEFTLVSQNVVQLSGGGQSTQFTFEALQKGRFSITLSPTVASGSKELSSRESIRYSIVVT